jgi:hypothetical protein
MTLFFFTFFVVGCDRHTPEQQARIDSLRERFDKTCEEYLAIRPPHRERRDNDCDAREYPKLGGYAAYEACQAEYTAYLAKADALEEMLYAAVRERDDHGYSWWKSRWICHSWTLE